MVLGRLNMLMPFLNKGHNDSSLRFLLWCLRLKECLWCAFWAAVPNMLLGCQPESFINKRKNVTLGCWGGVCVCARLCVRIFFLSTAFLKWFYQLISQHVPMNRVMGIHSECKLESHIKMCCISFSIGGTCSLFPACLASPPSHPNVLP